MILMKFTRKDLLREFMAALVIGFAPYMMLEKLGEAKVTSDIVSQFIPMNELVYYMFTLFIVHVALSYLIQKWFGVADTTINHIHRFTFTICYSISSLYRISAGVFLGTLYIISIEHGALTSEFWFCCWVAFLSFLCVVVSSIAANIEEQCIPKQPWLGENTIA